MLALRLTAAAVLAALLAGFGAAENQKVDPKAEPPKKDEPKKDAALKARLKKHEEDIARTREAMLKEIEAEEKRLEEAIKKAQADHTDAIKQKDFDAANKVGKAQSAARAELFKVQRMRFDIEARIRLPDPPPPPPPGDERLGLRLVAPDRVVIAQLGLEKNQGLVVDSVKPDSAGAKLGFQPADIWVKVDGKPVPSSVSALRKMLNELKPDAMVEVVVMRKGKPETVKGFAVPAPVQKD